MQQTLYPLSHLPSSRVSTLFIARTKCLRHVSFGSQFEKLPSEPTVFQLVMRNHDSKAGNSSSSIAVATNKKKRERELGLRTRFWACTSPKTHFLHLLPFPELVQL